MTFQIEFPDFPAADMPAMPEGFEDVNWHNDTCPSFHNAAERMTIFVDYVDVEKREFPENEGRFSLVKTDENGATVETIGEATDDWRTIEMLFEVFKA
jgi:hypothetical protein